MARDRWAEKSAARKGLRKRTVIRESVRLQSKAWVIIGKLNTAMVAMGNGHWINVTPMQMSKPGVTVKAKVLFQFVCTINASDFVGGVSYVYINPL